MTYWVESRTQMAPLRARKAPSLMDRICLGGWRYRPEGRLFLSESRLPVFASKGAVLSKSSLARARRAPSLAGGAPYLLRRAPSWAKRMFLVPEGRLCRQEGRRICLEWRSYVQKCHPFVTEGAFDGGMGPVSASKGAVTGKNGAFCARRAPARARGRCIRLRGRRLGQKGRFSYQKGALAVR